jgi:hypothetical protein
VDVNQSLKNYRDLLGIPDGAPTPCWVCEEFPAATTHEDHPICNGCLEHYQAVRSTQ